MDKETKEDLASGESRRKVLFPIAVVLLGWVFLELSVVIFEEGKAHEGRDILGMGATAACALVCLKWLRPAAWGAVVTAGLHVFVGGPSFAAWVLPVVYTALSAAFEHKRQSRLLLAAACVVWVPLSAADYGSLEHSIVYVTTAALPMLAAHGAGRAYNRWHRKQLRAERELAESAHSQRIALKEQRREIARDLHDVVAHDLTVISMHAQAVEEERLDSSTAAVLEAIRSSSAHALQDLRRLLDVLGDEGLVQEEPSDAAAVRFEEGIDRCASMLRDLGFTVGVTVGGEVTSLTQSLQNTLYRVLQECTTNVIKHGASRDDAYLPDCVICVEVTPRDVSLRVSNWVGDGVAGLEAGGLGLPSLRERVASFGGSFSSGTVAEGRWESVASKMHRYRYDI